jgi:hypothetical protein
MVPPSESSVSLSTSVEMTTRSRGAAACAGAAAVVAGTWAVAATAFDEGTPDAAGAAEALAGAALAAVLADEGKNVALLPLWTCHWSHNMTMEKPKITHRMVRRISFMKTSLSRKGRATG